MFAVSDRPSRRILLAAFASLLTLQGSCVEVPLTDGSVDQPDSNPPPSNSGGDDPVVVVEPPIEPASLNQPPFADAGEDRTITEGQWLRLDGTLSSDPDEDMLIFAWSVTSGPDFELSAADTAEPSFIAPQVAQDTSIVFTLTVSDGEFTASDEVEVLVQARIEAAGVGPVADAGADQTVDGGATVTLNGNDSSGDAGQTLSFQWSQLDGPGVTLTGGSSSSATFVAPAGLTADTALTFELLVHQGSSISADEVTVTVRAAAFAPPPGGGGAPPPPPPVDNCPADPNKTDPGVCGCGVPDVDTDGDGSMDCVDGCPSDPAKAAAGLCGCGVAETDRDGDGTPDCLDGCPDDPAKTNAADCPDPTALRDTDWNLYMLRLVNRARTDPAGEPARIGSSVTDPSAPVPPLAYDLLVGDAAKNHNDWMHDNLGSVPSGRTPDTFSHYETLDGLSNGTPATGTIGYTGANVGQRFNTVGYAWGTYGENILTNYATFDLSVDRSRIDASHRGWWESAGHRSNMLYPSFTAFGFHIESRTFEPPRGGLNAPFDNILFATQDFGRPLNSPRTHILALVYRDMDNNGAWTPRQVGDPLREGLSGVNFEVYSANTPTLVAFGTTLGNGGLSVRVADGTYDLVLTDPAFSGGQFVIQGIVIVGANVDAGDFRLVP